MKGHGVTKENNRIRFAAVTIERRRPIGIQGRAARGSMSHRFLAEFNRQFLVRTQAGGVFRWKVIGNGIRHRSGGDRKSTRLNSSHVANSYAVFCLKQKSFREMVR